MTYKSTHEVQFLKEKVRQLTAQVEDLEAKLAAQTSLDEPTLDEPPTYDHTMVGKPSGKYTTPPEPQATDKYTVAPSGKLGVAFETKHFVDGNGKKTPVLTASIPRESVSQNSDPFGWSSSDDDYFDDLLADIES